MLNKQDILDLASLLNDKTPAPRSAEVGGVPFAVLADGESLHSLARMLERPARSQGSITTGSIDSFCELVNQLETGRVRVYYTSAGDLDAILNDDDSVTPGWRDRRICYRPKPSPSWAAWCATFPDSRDGKWLDQLAMAEFIEERIGDFVSPTGAEMLELAQRFEVARSGTFASGVRLSSGATELTVTDTHEGRSTITIPSQVTLGMRVYEGMGGYQFKAAFRYRIRDGKLAMTFRVLHTADLLESAVADLLDSAKRGLLDGDTRTYAHVVAMPGVTQAP